MAPRFTIVETILRTIKNSLRNNYPEFLVYHNLNVSEVSDLLDTLERSDDSHHHRGVRIHFRAPDARLRIIIPSHLHESPTSWFRSEVIEWCIDGLLNPSFLQQLEINLPTVTSFIGPFAGSAMIPDVAVTPTVDRAANPYPSIVIESGWVESVACSTSAGEIWLTGTNGNVKVFIMVKLNRRSNSNCVDARLTISRMKIAGLIENNCWEIFPCPACSTEDPFVTIEELFGGQPPAALDSNKQLPLKIDRLRERMAQKLHEAGYCHA